jgi:hypothetical protein
MQPAVFRTMTCFAATMALCGQAFAQQLTFDDVTDIAGLQTPTGWKYGGPVVADLDRDGFLDLVLGNHDEHPAQIFWGAADGKFVEGEFPDIYRDVHGIAAGDYDRDGDLDLLVAVGGGNGKQPRPPILLRQAARKFQDVSAQSGLTGYGARGRAVRWIDIDSDGDLDIMAVNARQLPGETGPRNLLFENLGQQFRYRPSPLFESIEAERILVTDFNGDRKPDVVLFTPATLLENEGEFRFRDVTLDRLGEKLSQLDQVTAAAESDIDNDGDLDLYLARGKVYYEIANNALDFDAARGRLDLRDEGNRGSDGVGFSAPGPVVLSDFWHWRREPGLVLPLYVGADARRLDTPVAAVQIDPADAQGMPADRSRNGWYLGYLGAGKWRLEWTLAGDVAWDVRASLSGVSAVHPDWTPQLLDVPDVLLRNDGDRFTDVSAKLPHAAGLNNWGVVPGDFNNDGRSDFFLYHFGGLRNRIADSLLVNMGGGDFAAASIAGATTATGTNSHGDMGAAFDVDGDGRLDLLSGDDDLGSWHLYSNRSQNIGNWLEVRVGTSPRGTDAHGAVVRLSYAGGTQTRRVGSSGEVHSQSLIDVVHFGIGRSRAVDSITVIWRDGSQRERRVIGSNRTITIDGLNAQD